VWPDKQTIIQIVIFVFFAGAAIVQVIFRALAKTPKQPLAPREGMPQAGLQEKAVKSVRDFLKEIRAAAEKGADEGRQRESRKVPVPSEGQVLVWETVEEPKVAPRAQPADSRGKGKEQGSRRSDRDRKRAEGRSSAGRPTAPMAEVKGVHEYLQDLAHREGDTQEPALAPAGESPAAGLETAREMNLRGRSARVTRTLPRPEGLVGGLSIRDAMLAQVILGPPRCRGRHARRP
jgi:hypothetical protein